MIPQKEEDILNRVLYYGGFLQTYNELMRVLKSNESSTAILRGGPGVGKKTLLEAIEKNINNPKLDVKVDNNYKVPKKIMKGNKSDKIVEQKNNRTDQTRFIYLNPNHLSDDYTTAKYIAIDLQLQIRPSIQEIFEDIENRKGIKHDGKIVFVLLDFELFCNQKQSLLYSLTHLTQHGENINLLGVTTSLDCTRGLEKRVRSRLNALFFDLTLPYNSKGEYLEFASKLLGDLKITGNLKEKLEEMYVYGTRGLFHLKLFLVEEVCRWDKKKGLIVEEPKTDKLKSLQYGQIFPLEKVLHNLVSSQLQLLIIASCYCADRKVPDFNLMDLHDYCIKNNTKVFDAFCPQVLKNTVILERRKLFKSTDTKPNQIIGRQTKFTLEVSGPELAAVLKRNPVTFNVHLNKAILSRLG